MDIPRDDIIKARKLVDRLSTIKYVHYRELHPEIDETNYQTCTKVDFEAVDSPYENIRETWGRLKNSFKDQITTEFNSKSGSQYFTTKDGYVYRLSDHWGMVKTCLWTREGKGNMIASLKVYGPWEIGRAKISDFTLHRQPTDWNKDFVINPVWVEKIQSIVVITDILWDLKNNPEFKNLSGDDKFLIGNNWGRFSKELKSLPEKVLV